MQDFMNWLNTRYAGEEFGTDDGRRYVRIWHIQKPDRKIVLYFIDKTTGNILKPAGWKSPATSKTGSHIYGNINNSESWDKIKRVPWTEETAAIVAAKHGWTL